MLPYTTKQMFDLVADVERYPEFLPWCTGATILSREKNSFKADVCIGYGPFHETFTSDVKLMPGARVDVDYKSGPFRRLTNYWTFVKASGGCEVGFFIDFEFRSALLNATIGVMFEEAVKRMIAAFEKRAVIVYSR